MGFIDDVFKTEAFLDDIESDERILNNSRNRSIENGVYDDIDDDEDES